MKAVVVEKYDSIDNVLLRDVGRPDICAGQVRVRIQAASVGFVDGLKVQGLYQTKDPLPFTPGSEFAGVVDEAAADVPGFARGMPVMGMARSGGLAEYIAVPAAALEIMPEGITPEVGASFRANYLTSLYALSERAVLRAEEYLLVLGAAGRVIAAASTEEKLKFATRFGADATVDYTRADWRDAIKALTNGHGADVIFDPVGGDVSLPAFRSIAWRGRHLVVGFAAGIIPALPFNLPLLKGGALLGVDLAQIPRREPEAQKRVMSQLFTWLTEKKLDPVVGKVFAFENFREAFRSMQTRSALGKMVVKIN